jgi:hypothetical protein
MTWTSGTPAVATVAPNSGLAAALAAGASPITATLGSVAGTTTLTVTAVALQSITVTPVDPGIAVPQTAQFTATGHYADGTAHDITQAVTWSSASPAVAGIGNSSGLATAVTPGSTLVGATLGAVAGNTTLTVTPAALLSIGVTPANPSLSVPQSVQLTATGSYSDGSFHDISSFVTWTSATAGVASVTANGVATAATPGATLVTATMGPVVGSTVVTVTPAVLQSIAVTPANPRIAVTRSQQFVATGTYSDGSLRDISALVAWSSGTTAVAIVDGSGLASGVGAGTALVSAQLGAVSGSTTLTVAAVVLQSIAVTPTDPTILVSQSQPFVATGTYSDGTTPDISATVTWSSGTPSVATVGGAGLASGLSAGSSVITARSGTVSGSSTLTVTAPVVSAVSPRNITLGRAGTCAGGTLSTTFQVAAGSNVTWTAAADPQTPVLGGGSSNVSPAAGSGAGAFTVTITVPPQTPSSSYSSCSLTYDLGTFSNVYVTFSDGSVIGVTVYWTFVGVT